MKDHPDYVLGTGDDELARLSLQSRLWGDAALAAFRRAGIAPGQRVLDVGCGPGYAAFDLAAIVGPTGAVVGVDESAAFVEHANQQAEARGLPQLRARRGDVQELAAAIPGEAPFDLAYARWVLCFVADPAAVVGGVATRLRPGGRFVVHDYFNYKAFAMAPHSHSHDLTVAATIQSWRARGGDPDVVCRLPALFAEHGLDLVHLDVHQRVARPGDSMFTWPDVWWRTYAPKLVAMGLLAQTACEQLIAELTAMRESGNGFVHCPPVYELIARRT